MSRSPKLLNFSRMREIFEPHIPQIRENFFFSKELGIVHGNSQVFRLVIQQQPPPLAIDDYRFGVVLRGSATININLVEKHISEGTLVFVGPGTVITPIAYSDDLEIFGIALFNGSLMPFAAGQLPSAFNGQVRDFQIPAGEDDIKVVCGIIDTLWQLVHQHDYNRQTAGSLIAAFMQYYDGLYRRHADMAMVSMSREQSVFDRFIYLVNQYAQREHHIKFYADEMCLTERYLGTVIRQTSGSTAKEWIDRALVTRIKVELKHSDKPITIIADEMNFPTASFFCKYFKRLTGKTPLEYRSTTDDNRL